MALKRKFLVSTDQFQFRLIVHYHRVSLNQFQVDLMLHYKIKALQKLKYDQFCLWFWIALKRKLPVSTEQFEFRLTVHYPSVSLSQFQDDLMLHYIIKALQISFYLFCLWFWIDLKRKLPVSTDQFQFRLIVHYPRVSLNQFQDDLMLHYIIKALQISYSTCSACDFGKF